jgi:hypothetical protein
MRTVPLAIMFPAGAIFLGGGLLTLSMLQPEAALALLPAAVAVMVALLFYQVPVLAVALLIGCYGLALDIQLDLMAESGAGGNAGTLGAAVVKVIPFGIAAMLCLRYGFQPAINWPFLAFTAIAFISLVVLPIGRVSTMAEMVRSFIGSTAPFILAFAAAPRPFWSALCKGTILVPLISAVAGLVAATVGFYPAFDSNWRFQGLHSPPFLAGFCTTAIFAATLEYLRTFRTRWLVLGGAALVVLLASQARAPLIAVVLFLLIIFLFSGPRTFPAKRKVDLMMGGLLPAAVVIGPVLVFAADRLFGPATAPASTCRAATSSGPTSSTRSRRGRSSVTGSAREADREPRGSADPPHQLQRRAQRIPAPGGGCGDHRLRRHLPLHHRLGLGRHARGRAGGPAGAAGGAGRRAAAFGLRQHADREHRGGAVHLVRRRPRPRADGEAQRLERGGAARGDVLPGAGAVNATAGRPAGTRERRLDLDRAKGSRSCWSWSATSWRRSRRRAPSGMTGCATRSTASTCPSSSISAAMSRG